MTWLLLGVGYYLLRKDDDVATSLDLTILTWPVTLLDEQGRRTGRGTSRITQEYRPPTHMGVDISVPGHYKDARADVVALAAGKVAGAYEFVRGWAVLLDHGDWASGYLHMTELDPAIRDGALVAAGQRLGPMGSDPSDPEGVVHLHLQIAPGGHTTDPAPYLARAV
jgi:murein DD-endopeptidase MepM/ murein hydrolase activator NlpD